MLSCCRRFLLAASVLLSAVLSARADSPAPPPTPKQIAQWIKELGDDSFMVREKASQKLWDAGGAAVELALEKAAASDDPEVVRRSRELLEKFRWGIYPDTPADIVALIRAYQASEGNARMELLKKLLDSGDAGRRAVIKIARAEPDANQRQRVRAVIADKLPEAFVKAVTSEKYESFERLLELGHESHSVSHRQYAAYWLLRGKLPERIRHFQARWKQQPDDAWCAATLVYLHRAAGDLPAARKAAEKAGDDKLLEGILYEIADWKTLAERSQQEMPVREAVSAVNLAQTWASRAAYARLAGRNGDFENAVHELKKFTRDKDDELPAFVAAKSLLLNDRSSEGMELLRTLPEHQSMLFDLLCVRLEFAKAMELPDPARPAKRTVPTFLELSRARTLCVLGEKDKARKRFTEQAEQIKEVLDSEWAQALLREERRAGLMDLASDHAARILSVSPDKRTNGVPDSVFLAELFPEHATKADVWWFVLRHRFKDDSAVAVMKRVRAVMEGKAAATDVKVWIEASGEPEVAVSAKTVEGAATKLQALGETAAAHGLDDLAAALLKKADSPDALVRLGDLRAARKQWDKAAEHYRRAWQKQLKREKPNANRRHFDPLPLYLAGDALVHAGQEKEGQKLMEQAHWMPLADADTRVAFLRALAQRGHTGAVRREWDLLLRVSEPNSLLSGEALRRRAITALRHKDYLKAVEGFEQSMLHCLRPSIGFVNTASYANVPAHIHQLRASALLEAGKIQEALKEADLALTVSPGYVDLPIALVPELERRGHKKEAAALFERCQAVYEKVCRDYPRCAWGHNSSAWMAACCRRNLERALQHAQKAVELEPTNAGYIDTLAEIHFQRGDREKAIALQKRAIELDPKKTYFRKQLKRLQAGDPATERPAEDDDE